MRESQYLYGEHYDVDTLKQLHYPNALLRKILWSKELLDELLKEPYADNNNRINAICKAMKFNQALYDELYFSYYNKEIE